MTFQDFWFESRYMPDLFGRPKQVDFMVTTHTAKKAGDPYNGTGIVEPPTVCDRKVSSERGKAHKSLKMRDLLLAAHPIAL
eukprot:3858013-Amphidinium_carterae.1